MTMGYRPLMLTAALLVLTAAPRAQPTARSFLDKPSPEAVRVLTWNVYHDSIFPADGERVDATAADRPARFARILRAVQPDIVCLQQIDTGAARSAALFNEVAPRPDGEAWQAHSAIDTAIVTRFPIAGRDEGRVEEGDRPRGHAIAMIKAPRFDLYVMCAHFQSSDGPEDIAQRKAQADLLVRTIMTAKEGRGTVPMAPRTPFVVLGDFNAIPKDTAFVEAMLAGIAASTAADGSVKGLDWDGSRLTDALPHHNSSGTEVYTWRNDLEPFPPSALDRILYSDSVLAIVNRFVLDTMAMSHDELVRSGMRAVDAMLDPQAGIHDHLPLVVDLETRRR